MQPPRHNYRSITTILSNGQAVNKYHVGEPAIPRSRNNRRWVPLLSRAVVSIFLHSFITK